jgi:hypothetical protein
VVMNVMAAYYMMITWPVLNKKRSQKEFTFRLPCNSDRHKSDMQKTLINETK